MLIDRSHSRWLKISTVVLLVGIVTYVLYVRNSPNGPTGGSIPGLLYGIIGSLMMIFAGLLAGRKPLRILRLGSAQFWLRGHLWLGALCVPFLLFHAGFGWGGLVENLLWITLAVVVVSGFIGLALQNILPNTLTARVKNQTVSSAAFQSERAAFLSDIEVATRCGHPLTIDGHSLMSVLRPLHAYYDKSDREAKRLWMYAADIPQRELLINLANCAKDAKLINSVDKFPEAFPKIYQGFVQEKPAAEKKAAPAAAKSPLEAAREQAKKSPAKSPLEQARAAGAASAEEELKKPLSPLEMARQQGNKGKPAEKTAPPKAAAETPPGDKPLSPLELARQQGGKAAGKTTAPKTAEVKQPDDKPLSPLEMARQQGKKQAPSKPTDDAPSKPLSPLEQARQQGKQAGAKPEDAPKKSPPVKPPVARKTPPVAAATKTPKVVIPAEDLQRFEITYLTSIRPYLLTGSFDRNSIPTTADGVPQFDSQGVGLPKELHDDFLTLIGRCRDRHDFQVQRRLEWWLHSWLMIHIPISMALFVLFVAHVVMALRVVPFGN